MYVSMPTFVDTVCYARHHGNLCRHISSASCHSSNAAAASAVDWPHVVRRQVKVDETMCSCPRFRSPCLHTRIPPEEVAAVDSIISIVYQSMYLMWPPEPSCPPRLRTWRPRTGSPCRWSTPPASRRTSRPSSATSGARVGCWHMDTRLTYKVSRLPSAPTAVALLRLHLPLGRVLEASHLGHQEQQAQHLEPHESAFRQGPTKQII